MLRTARSLAALALTLSLLGCAGTPQAPDESAAPEQVPIPPHARVDKDPDAHGNPGLGLSLFGSRITAPPGYTLTTIYRFYRRGELDERQSRAWRTWGTDGADDRLMLGVLDPDATRPEPSPMIRIVGPTYTARNSWFEVGDTKDTSLSWTYDETGPIGREIVLGELTINEPMREQGDTSTRVLKHEAPIWVTASYRVDPMTQEQHDRLTGTMSISEVVRIGDLPPLQD